MKGVLSCEVIVNYCEVRDGTSQMLLSNYQFGFNRYCLISHQITTRIGVTVLIYKGLKINS